MSGRKSKRSLDNSDQNKDEEKIELKPNDYEGLVIDAIEQINDIFGSDRKSVRKFLNETKKINIPLKLVGLCLESAAVAGRLKQIERKGASFYVIQEKEEQEQMNSSLDNSEVNITESCKKSEEELDNMELVKPALTTEKDEKESDANELERMCEPNKQETVGTSKEKPDPTCPVCFKMLLNSEKMKLHIKDCHGNEETKRPGETQDNSLKFTIHLSSEKKKIRIRCKNEEQ